MPEAVAIALNGTASVFLGMAVLYLTIRCTAAVVRRWGPKGEKP
jgi:hypothetical protein